MLLKTFLASLAAKIAVGTGLALATVSAAGAAGVLPEPAQKAVEAVAKVATPLVGDDSGPVTSLVEDDDDLTTTTTSTTVASDNDEDGEDGGGTTDPARKANHGACVSTVAKNTSGPDKGKTVSSVARSDCGKTSTSTTVAPTSTTSTTVGGTSTTSSTIEGERSANLGSGRGNNANKANSANGGNSGKGNSAKK